jgi:hypothetical protein
VCGWVALDDCDNPVLPTLILSRFVVSFAAITLVVQMLSLCVFRRYGLAVPVLFFIIGFILERWLNAHSYDDDSSSHLGSLGLTLFLTGSMTGILACIVDPPPTSNDYAYSAIRDGDLEDIRKNVQDSWEHFVYDETSEDMFCYLPLNRCAMCLMGVGILVLLVSFIHS